LYISKPIAVNKPQGLHQGSFLMRLSKLFVKVGGAPEDISSIEVAGDVCMIASGRFDRNVLSV
jgi:hypothetical protein